MALLLGDDGSKVMFYFYLTNGCAAYVTYALLFAPAIGYYEQVIALLFRGWVDTGHGRGDGVVWGTRGARRGGDGDGGCIYVQPGRRGERER